VPDGPGLGVTLDSVALNRLHQVYPDAGITERDDALEIRKHWPNWQFGRPKFGDRTGCRLHDALSHCTIALPRPLYPGRETWTRRGIAPRAAVRASRTELAPPTTSTPRH